MKVIMTASRKDNAAHINAENNAALLATVQDRLGITGEPVKGYWKGEPENSFIFHGVNLRGLLVLIHLAGEYKQDAFLIVRDDKRGILWSRDDYGTWVSDDIGDWQQVSSHVARMFDGYTRDRAGRFFVACTKAERAAAERRSMGLLSLMQIETAAYADMAV